MILSPERGVGSGLALGLSSIALLGSPKIALDYHHTPNQQHKIEMTIDKIQDLGSFLAAADRVTLEFIDLAKKEVKPHKKKHVTKKADGLPLSDLPPELVRIGGCESVHNPKGPINYTAQNPTSSASGGFEEIDSTWADQYGVPHAKDATPDEQNAAALKLYEQAAKEFGDATAPWVSSKACWD